MVRHHDLTRVVRGAQVLCVGGIEPTTIMAGMARALRRRPAGQALWRHQTPKASPGPLPIPSFHRNAGSTCNWFPGGGSPWLVRMAGFSAHGPLKVPRWPLAVVNAP